MFEKFFGRKKVQQNSIEGLDSTKSATEGVVHFDGTKNENDLLDNNDDFLQEGFDNIDSSQRVSTLRKRDAEKFGTNWKELSTKVSNERNKEKLGERNSGVENEDLLEESKIFTKEENDETHLNANAEHYYEDDSDLEKAA